MPTRPIPERDELARVNWAVAVMMLLGAGVWALAIWGFVCLIHGVR